jgi:hypothetical protein
VALIKSEARMHLRGAKAATVRLAEKIGCADILAAPRADPAGVRKYVLAALEELDAVRRDLLVVKNHVQ